MARGVMGFLCETQARLGLVNTPLERGVFEFLRGVRAVLVTPRRATAAILLAVLFSGVAASAYFDPNAISSASSLDYPTDAALQGTATAAGAVAPTGYPVKDIAQFNQRAQQYFSKTTADRLRDLWKETGTNTRWLTDIVQTYRTIKMAKTQYDSLASLNLMGNLQIVDFLPELQLQPGTYFGTPQDGFTTTTNPDGSSKETYLGLRFRQRQGGVAALFQNWPKFKPNLSINTQALANQLANLDFDAVQLIQYRDTQGNPIGKAIESGNPREASSKIAAYWDGLLNQANDWVTFKSQAAALLDSQQVQMALSEQAYQQRASDLQSRINQTDQENRSILGLPVTTGTKSMWDAHYAPQIQLGAQLLNLHNQADQQSIKLLTQKLQDIKAFNEVAQSSVTYFREAGEIDAETQQALNQQLKGFDEILKRYKVERTDSGESIANTIGGTLHMASVDLSGMKLPPPAEAEIQRLFARTAGVINMQQMRLVGLREKTRRVEAMDRVGAEVYNAQQNFAGLAQMKTDEVLAGAARQAEQAVDNYNTYVESQATIHRQEDAQAFKNLMTQFGSANTLYFTAFKDRTNVVNVFNTLMSTYGGFLKAFFNGRSLTSVMGDQAKNMGNIKNVSPALEWAMYEQCATGVSL